MFNTVLVGVDGRSGGHEAAALAKLLASPRAKVTLAHVYGNQWPVGRGGTVGLEVERAAAEEMLERERAQAGLDAETTLNCSASAARGLHELVDSTSCDLLVLGSCHRSRVGRVLLGDDTQSCLHGSRCAVAVAPRGFTPGTTISHIGIGHDDSPEANLSLEVARRLARRFDARLSALSVVSLNSLSPGEAIPSRWPKLAGEMVTEEAHRLNSLEGVDGDAAYGETGEELARFSDQLDLLIVGSRGYGPLGRLLNGSTSGYLARHARCPLLVLPRRAEFVGGPLPAGTGAGITG